LSSAGDVSGFRAFVRDLPGQLREVKADSRRLGRSIRDLWPVMWVANADRQVEIYSQQAFDSGREYGRQELELELEALAALEPDDSDESAEPRP
jgi:hypothetical protein